MDTTSGGDLFGHVWAYIIKAFGGGACVDTDTGFLPQNFRDRHRLLPQKLVLLLYMDFHFIHKRINLK
jgi:hypothetical protein